MSALRPSLDSVELVTREGRTQLRAAFRLTADAPILAGHFPGAPLVPGVLLVEAVREACEHAFACTFGLREVADLRFWKPVQPGETVALAAEVVHDGEPLRGVTVEGQWLGAGGKVATFTLRLGPPHA